jgi:hypothetical protein
MHEPMPLEEAASTLRCSVRTIQRRIAAGQLKAEMRDGRTMVLVERPSGAAIAQLQEQADHTAKVAALTAVTGERAAIAYQERAAELEMGVRWWRRAALVAGGVGVASLVTLSWLAGDMGATRDMLSDTRARLDRAEAARAGLERELAGATWGDRLARNDTSAPPWRIPMP